MKLMAVICLLGLLMLGCGCGPGLDEVAVETDPYQEIGQGERGSGTETSDFAAELAAHLVLPAPQRARLREQAEGELIDWEKFEGLAHHNYERNYRRWYYAGLARDRTFFGDGLMNSIRELSAATRIDPSFTEAWAGLGHLCLEIGDLNTGLRSLDNARLTVRQRAAAGDPVPQDLELAVLIDRAWALRDMGRWEEGLEAVSEGLESSPGHPDLVLIKGLMLAGAGRYVEATSLAVRMEPISYRMVTEFYRGIRHRDSDYANRWIRSQALLAVGDIQGARHVLGAMEFYPYRHGLPHMVRFWNDVGVVAELAGDPEADVYYAISFISNPYFSYFPHGADNLGSLVLDVPDPRLPYFTSFGSRFYLAGSPFSYIAAQMNLMAGATFPQQKAKAAWRALQMLEITERRHIRPDVCRALRGRVYFNAEDYAEAAVELASARESFAAAGLVDPGTSLLLGMLGLKDKDYRGAVPFLEEAVAADPESAVGWRSLGIVYAHGGRFEEASGAMDRALALEPRSVEGLYNRGLLSLQKQDFAAAVADLEAAWKLSPDDREVQRLLQMAAAGSRGQDGTDGSRSWAGYSSSVVDSLGLRSLTGDPEQLLAGLEADIQAFFSVPDSMAAALSDSVGLIRRLEERYALSADPRDRKALALALIDKAEFTQAQVLLAPGWGQDLDPQEEVMLLYVDRVLGQQERAERLAAAILRGEAGAGNPYILPFLTLKLRNDTRVGASEVLKDLLKWCFSATTENPFPNAAKSQYLSLGFARTRSRYLPDEDDDRPAVTPGELPRAWGRGAVGVGSQGVGKD